MSSSYVPIKLNKITPLKDSVIVSEMNFEERLSHGGIILKSDDGKSAGIRARWAKVYAIGPEQEDVKVGEWIFVAHGRWTRGVNIIDDAGTELTIRKVDVDDILLSSDARPNDDSISVLC